MVFRHYEACQGLMAVYRVKERGIEKLIRVPEIKSQLCECAGPISNWIEYYQLRQGVRKLSGLHVCFPAARAQLSIGNKGDMMIELNREDGRR
jgi:hypothetical protein